MKQKKITKAFEDGRISGVKDSMSLTIRFLEREAKKLEQSGEKPDVQEYLKGMSLGLKAFHPIIGLPSDEIQKEIEGLDYDIACESGGDAATMIDYRDALIKELEYRENYGKEN